MVKNKIGFINVNGTWGGAEKVLNNIISTPLYENFEVYAYLGAKGKLFEQLSNKLGRNINYVDIPELKDDGKNWLVVNLFFSMVNVFILIAASIKIGILIRRDKLDILYLNNQQAILLSPILRLLNCNVKIFGHEHTIQPSILRQFFYDIIVYLFVDKLITVSNATLNTHFKYMQRKVVKIYNGFDFEYEIQNESSLTEPINYDSYTFLLPAVFRRWKGHAVLLDAACILKGRGVDFTILLIGDEVLASEEGLKAELHSQVRVNQLENVVKFLGFKYNVLAYMKCVDSVIQPSTLPDPLPTTVLEALYLGKPVIGSKIGGIPEMVINDYNGYCVEVSNPFALADAMEKLVRNKINQAKFGHNSKILYEDKFSHKVFMSNILSTLNEY